VEGSRHAPGSYRRGQDLSGIFNERFEREARAIAAVNHPNISQLYDVGPNYLVMEFVEGSPIARADGVRKQLDVAVQIADGLAAAQAEGILHCDLKPDNCWIAASASTVSGDFPNRNGWLPGHDSNCDS
jgi:serine/threonine protein kinase